MQPSAPETASSLTPGLHALLTSAAFAPLPSIGWLRITGSDRVRWLNGMITNNIAALHPGQGNYNFFLNAQGRIQGDATAWMQEDAILLQTAADRIPALMTMLDHFIIMDDVELAPLDARHGLLLTGPDAPTYLHALDLLPPSESCIRTHTFAGCPLDLIYAYHPLIPTYEFWSDPATIAALTVRLAHIHAAPVEATPADLESLRILSGTPLYGTDIRNSETAKDLPQETNQTRALHFAKGCYLGQEIVERIRSRGAVHRTFTGFLLEGIKPEPGTGLQSDEKTIGELTSVARIGSSIYALGYIRREALERKATITYPGGIATPAALPFLLPEMSA